MYSRLFSAQKGATTTRVRQFSVMTPEILNDFYEVPASFVSENFLGIMLMDKSSDQYKIHYFTWRIDLNLSSAGDPANSPHHHIFTDKYQLKHDVKRHLETSVYCRGDDRTIQQIQAAGKIKPKGEDIKPQPIDAYDVSEHRKSSHHSYFVSGTKKMGIAHKFGQSRYAGEGKYTVYLMKAQDTLGPHLQIDKSKYYPSFTTDEEEYSILGGVKYNDIVGFRECSRLSSHSFSYFCGNIYVSKTFAKQHKEHVGKVIEVQKFPDEVKQSRLKN